MAIRKYFMAAVAAASLFAPSSSWAANFSFTGNFTQDNDVQLFNFTVGAASTNIVLRTWSYAGGQNAQGATIAPGGFDPILALFDAATGALIDNNDDGSSSQVMADPVTGAFFDTYLFIATLAPGNYTVAVSQFDNFPVGSLLSEGFSRQGPGSETFTAAFGCPQQYFCDVTGDNRDAHWAFDILNVESADAVSGVPVPAAFALFPAGLGVLGLLARRRKRQAAA